MSYTSLLSLNPLLAFILISTSVVAYGQEIKRFDLKESVRVALANNWALKAKKEKIEQATEVRNQARTEFLPKFATRYSYTRLDDELKFKSELGQDFQVSTKDNFESVTSITQPLFSGFAILSNYELAKLGIDKSVLDVELEELDLALRAKQAYFDILIADKGIEVAEKDVEFRESNLKVARSFYEVGMVPINDVLRAEVELANSQQYLVSSRNVARLARATFNKVLSRSVNEPVEVVGPKVAYEPMKGEFQDYVNEALANRPEMRLVDVGILQAEQERRLAASQYYPDIVLTWEYIREGEDADVAGDEFHQDPRWQVTTGLTWTFWEWGKTRYAVMEKESQARELVKVKRELEDSIRLEVKEAILSLENAEENIPTTEKAVKQGEENLRVNEERYKAQVTTITDALEAQTILTRARVNYWRALYNHNLAKARLERAVGRF